MYLQRLLKKDSAFLSSVGLIGVLSDHLESFKSKGNKITYTINMQRS